MQLLKDHIVTIIKSLQISRDQFELVIGIGVYCVDHFKGFFDINPKFTTILI